MSHRCSHIHETPLGTLTITADRHHIFSILFHGGEGGQQGQVPGPMAGQGTAEEPMRDTTEGSGQGREVGPRRNTRSIPVQETEEGEAQGPMRTWKTGQASDLHHPLIRECVIQLDEYFAGRRTEFDLPLAPRGTPFQREVWDELRGIPHGEKRSYRDIAATIGRPKAARAVGNAMGRNPLTIVIPCHRVIAGDGRIGGFSCGIWRKEWLLGHEKRHCMTGVEGPRTPWNGSDRGTAHRGEDPRSTPRTSPHTTPHPAPLQAPRSPGGRTTADPPPVSVPEDPVIMRELFWIVPGKLAGCRYPSTEELGWIHRAGFRTLVALEPRDDTPLLEGMGFEIHAFAVPDFTAPTIGQLDAFARIVREAGGARPARPVLVHCLGGYGRTGTMLAGYLIREKGYSTEEAIRFVREQRPGAIEVEEQVRVLHRYGGMVRRMVTHGGEGSGGEGSGGEGGGGEVTGA